MYIVKMFCFEIINISLTLSNIKSPLTIIALFLIFPLPFLCDAKIVKILFNKSTFIDKNVLKDDEVGWLRRRIEQVEERGR